MKKIIFSTLLISISILSYSQGDCLSSASNIGTCGFFFAGNNSTFGDCPGDLCGCVGGGSNPSNLDNDCSTECGGCNCGSDFTGSIENSMFWNFRPTEDCDYELCITPDNCVGMGAGTPYMQVWIGQVDTTTGLITEYYHNDNNNAAVTTGNTVCYTFSVTQASGDVVMMVDGNAGTECDINLDINQIDCSDTCPIIVVVVDLKILNFSAKSYEDFNMIHISLVDLENDDNVDAIDILRSGNGTIFKKIGEVSTSNVDQDISKLKFKDSNPLTGYNYYKIRYTSGSRTMISKIVNTYSKIKTKTVDKIYDLNGTEIENVDSHQGVEIILYNDGTIEKNINITDN